MPNNQLSPSIVARKIKDIKSAEKNMQEIRVGQYVKVVLKHENGKSLKKIITGKVISVNEHNFVVQTYYDPAFKKEKYRESVKMVDLYDKSVEMYILPREAA